MAFAETSADEQKKQPYKYNRKELDQELGLNTYDYSARYFDPALPRFTTVDPLAEKYYSISPYVYVANNPIRNIDINGDSITVLNMGSGTNQHMAILIQNDKGKWQYFSVNGDNVYIPGTDIHLGGRKFDDLAVGEFDSPEQFIQSAYNSKGDKDDKSVDKYGFTEGYTLATTPEQDFKIRETFIGISQNEEYGIFSNNCATAVQRSLGAVGIKTSETKRMTDVMIGPSTKEVTPWLPSQAFKAIMKSNPNGTYIRKISILMNKNKLFINISVIYWIIQAIIIFSMQGFGIIPKILSVSILVVCLLKWIVPNGRCNYLYSVLMIVYSVIYLTLTGILLIFFGEKNIVYLSLILIALLNLSISISTFVFFNKGKVS